MSEVSCLALDCFTLLSHPSSHSPLVLCVCAAWYAFKVIVKDDSGSPSLESDWSEKVAIDCPDGAWCGSSVEGAPLSEVYAREGYARVSWKGNYTYAQCFQNGSACLGAPSSKVEGCNEGYEG